MSSGTRNGMWGTSKSPNRPRTPESSLFPSYKSLLSSAKTKMYNYYKQATDEPAEISSDSPIWMLGENHLTQSQDHNELEEWTMIDHVEKTGEALTTSNPVSYSFSFDEDLNYNYTRTQPTLPVPKPPSRSISPNPLPISNSQTITPPTRYHSPFSSSPSPSPFLEPLPLSSTNPPAPSPRKFANTPPAKPLSASAPGSSRTGSSSKKEEMIKRFKLDLYSRIYCSYREGFVPIIPSELTTDCGWGCMIRTMQMMVAQALQVQFQGRKWRFQPEDAGEGTLHEQILRWFHDSPSPEAHYSIHRVAHIGHILFDKKIGQWYEPTLTCLIFQILLEFYRPKGMKMILARDGLVFRHDVISRCTHEEEPFPNSPNNTKEERKEKTEDIEEEKREEKREEKKEESSPKREVWVPCIITLPVRLGLDVCNTAYKEALKETFTFPQSLGVVGGRKNQSLWFVATQDDYIFYLDPHRVQPCIAAGPESLTHSYHSEIPRKLKFEEMDPSMALGFLIKSREDFIDFCERVNRMNERVPMGLFSVCDDESDWAEEQSHLQKKGEQALMDFEQLYKNSQN